MRYQKGCTNVYAFIELVTFDGYLHMKAGMEWNRTNKGPHLFRNCLFFKTQLTWLSLSVDILQCNVLFNIHCHA